MRGMFLNKFFNIKQKIILDRLFYQCEEMGIIMMKVIETVHEASKLLLF